MPLLRRWGQSAESHKHLIELSWEFGKKNVPEVQEICCYGINSAGQRISLPSNEIFGSCRCE